MLPLDGKEGGRREGQSSLQRKQELRIRRMKGSEMEGEEDRTVVYENVTNVHVPEYDDNGTLTPRDHH